MLGESGWSMCSSKGTWTILVPSNQYCMLEWWGSVELNSYNCLKYIRQIRDLESDTPTEHPIHTIPYEYKDLEAV